MSVPESFSLPSGWAVATISELVGAAGIFSDGDWVESKDQDPSGDVRLVQLADVGDGRYLNRSSRFLTSVKARELRCTYLEPGDLLLARMPDPLGRACIFPGDSRAAVTVVDVCIVRTNVGDIDQRWLMWTVNSPAFRVAVANLQSGSTRKRISRGNLATLCLPIPPAPEQRRIVAAIEEQLTRLDSAVAALKRVQANLKRYRASVLKMACEGKLVPTEAELARVEAREYEPACVLLKRIAENSNSDLFFGESSTGHELPDGWCWAVLGQFGRIGTGSTPLRSNPTFYEGGDVPWITSGALNAPFVKAPTGFVTEKAYHECNLTRYVPGTLLIAMYGEGKTRGKCSELLIEATTNQAIAAVVTRGLGAACKPYLKLVLERNYFEIRRESSGGVQPNLNLGLVRRIRVPLPPLAEQMRIVEEAERHLSIIADMELAVARDLTRAERLRQSILKRAFEGKLVPQDRNDEPASVLLERIRAERSAGTVNHKRRTRMSPDSLKLPL